MTFSIIQPRIGRGSFVTGTKIGGTLDSKGLVPGSYYRAPANKSVKMPGITGALAVINSTEVSMNDYAVHRAVYELQRFFGAVQDGILGPNTHQSIVNYQMKNHLIVDGAIGPQTCKTLLDPILRGAAQRQDAAHGDLLYRISRGTINVESGYDLGAIGMVDSYDTGIAQINRKAHPDISINNLFNPREAIPWMVNFIDNNLKAMKYDEDAGIIAYNLGVSGAWYWIDAGRPQWFRGTDTVTYIANVKKG